MNYLLHIVILVNLYVVLSVSLNLLAGYTGLLSICQAGFYGLGAYATALLSIRLGWTWTSTLTAGALLSGVAAFGIGRASLRFRDDYFVIATFAFQVILYSIMLNWSSLTQGAMGLPGVSQPSFFGWHVSSQWGFLTLSGVLSVTSFLLVLLLVSSPYGRALKALREDEVLARAMAKDTETLKISAFVFGAILAAGGGSFYAGYITFIDPSSFTVSESIFILAIVIIGGAGNLWGSVVGAAVLVSLPEALRFVGLPPVVAANMRQILYGAALVACMMWRPQGLIGEFSFRRDENS